MKQSLNHFIGLLSSPNCADQASAPYTRVTKVALRVVKEIKIKIVEKSTGRVLDQYTEEVRKIVHLHKLY